MGVPRRPGTLAVIAAPLMMAGWPLGSHSCSNFLVSRGATADNSTHLAYNSDGEAFYGYMTHLSGGPHSTGTVREIYEFGTGIYRGAIPEAATTFNVIGNMNEKQVAIGETTFQGLDSLSNQPGAIIDYYSLMWLALQRSATAREAIRTMDLLTKKYGYASTGESFSISDPNEVWHMDFIGRGAGEMGGVWVARRVPEGYVGGHANQARITTWPRDPETAMWSEDIVEFAQRKKLYPTDGDPLKFSFADVFDPPTPVSARLCEARVWEMFRHVAADSNFGEKYIDYVQGRNMSNRMPLFIAAAKPIALNDTFWQMRRHYEGSWFDTTDKVGAGPYHSVYRARPLTFTQDGKQYAFNRNLGYVGTFFHFVAHARPSATGVIWFGVDDASLSALVPMYSVTNKAPSTWAYGNGNTGEFSLRSAYWAFNVVSNFAMARYDVVGAEVQRRIVETEAELMAKVKEMDSSTAPIIARDGVEAAVGMLSNFSVTTADAVVDQWVAMFPSLMVQFRDGLIVGPPTPPANPKDQPPPPDCSSPGYGKDWYARVVADTGSQYLIPPTEDRIRAHSEHKLLLLSRR